MNRTEAESLVGQSVEAWTAANGIYVGILEAVIALKGRPWRGTVRVTGVLAPAQHLERGALCRRGFRPGETLELGGVNLAPNTQVGTDYATALKQRIHHLAARLAQQANEDPHAWVTHGNHVALTQALAAEEARLQGQPWSLKGTVPAYRPASLSRH